MGAHQTSEQNPNPHLSFSPVEGDSAPYLVLDTKNLTSDFTYLSPWFVGAT